MRGDFFLVRHAVSPERLRDLQRALTFMQLDCFQRSGALVSFHTSFLVLIVLGAFPFDTFPP